MIRLLGTGSPFLIKSGKYYICNCIFIEKNRIRMMNHIKENIECMNYWFNKIKEYISTNIKTIEDFNKIGFDLSEVQLSILSNIIKWKELKVDLMEIKWKEIERREKIGGLLHLHGY